MEDKDLWATFEKTGRISDYLQYKSQYGGELSEAFPDKKEQTGDRLGEGEIESDSNSHRYDTVRSTYRGI